MIGLTPVGVVRMYHVVHMYHHAGTSTNVLLPGSRRRYKYLAGMVVVLMYYPWKVVVRLYHYHEVVVRMYWHHTGALGINTYLDLSVSICTYKLA